MRFTIVTGSSRGLGLAITNRLLREGHHVFGISRTDPEFDDVLERSYEHLSCDLNQFDQVESTIREIFRRISQTTTVDGLYLINNAASLTPLGPIDTTGTAEIIRHFQVNLLAPIVLSARFIVNVKYSPPVNPIFSLR